MLERLCIICNLFVYKDDAWQVHNVMDIKITFQNKQFEKKEVFIGRWYVTIRMTIMIQSNLLTTYQASAQILKIPVTYFNIYVHIKIII